MSQRQRRKAPVIKGLERRKLVEKSIDKMCEKIVQKMLEKPRGVSPWKKYNKNDRKTYPYSQFSKFMNKELMKEIQSGKKRMQCIAHSYQKWKTQINNAIKKPSPRP